MSMKPTTMQFGDKPPRDWRKHSPMPTAKDEAADSEDGTPADAEFAAATLGFDPKKENAE